MENITNPEIFDNNGNVNISDEVVAVIASLAASGVDGVVGMVSGVAGGIAELIGKKNLSKGVKIVKTENRVALDLSVIVEYGAKIPDVAWEVQEKVKNEVEAMTGLEVTAVNISVEGVTVTSDNEKAQKAEKAEEKPAENTACETETTEE